MSTFKLPPHGGAYGFPTTDASLLDLATGKDEKLARRAFGDLWDRYCRPFTCYLRAGRVSQGDVKDLLQGFALWLWDEDKLSEYDREKSPFRGFMMTLLDRYRTDVWRKETTQSRKPRKRLESLDTPEVMEVADAECSGPTPQGVYQDECFREILRMALAQELKRVREKGDEKAIALIEAWLGSANPGAPDYSELAAASGLTPKQVDNQIASFRKRAREAARALLNAETLDHERSADDYARMLATFGILGGGDADRPSPAE